MGSQRVGHDLTNTDTVKVTPLPASTFSDAFKEEALPCLPATESFTIKGYGKKSWLPLHHSNPFASQEIMEKADGKIIGSHWLKWVLVTCSCSFFWLEHFTPSLGFPHGSVGKESACNAGDPSSIPGSGRSLGEEIGYPLQCSWASLVAQLVKNPLAMWETWVRSLGSQRVRHSWATFTFTPSSTYPSAQMGCLTHGF